MNQKLKEKILESLRSVLPITMIVLILSILFVPMEIGIVAMFLVGALILIIGMGFFQLGAEMAMIPLGEGMGVQISKRQRIITIILITFITGTIITIAEPDLQVLANQVPSIPNVILIWTVALGVGACLVLAILRTLFKINLSSILFILYGIIFLVSLFTPSDFLSVSFDSGGVTTGPITVPFIMAMGIGLASVRIDKNANEDSFGLVALSSIGPILAVMLLGIFFNPIDSGYIPATVATVVTTRDIAHEFLLALPIYAKEVIISLLPIAGVFIIFQLTTRRYQHKQRIRMIVGFIYTYIGLVFFLMGVSVGFAPVGSLLGLELASSRFKWLLIPIGMLIGYFIVKAEPAIQVLNHQVENVTNGSISASAMNYCLSIGVAISVGLAMLRVLTGISLYWIILPGYLIALLLSKIVPKIFVGIAFDSGGVASGPMTSTFLLPLCIGACQAVDGNIMTDAFGVVALVAMTPLIAILIMGVVYKYKSKDKNTYQNLSVDDSDEIIDLEDAY
ncbi:MAG: DUF1538 domain-containing protein [Eubacteriaceae bacterium]